MIYCPKFLAARTHKSEKEQVGRGRIWTTLGRCGGGAAGRFTLAVLINSEQAWCCSLASHNVITSAEKKRRIWNRIPRWISMGIVTIGAILFITFTISLDIKSYIVLNCCCSRSLLLKGKKRFCNQPNFEQQMVVRQVFRGLVKTCAPAKHHHK